MPEMEGVTFAGTGWSTNAGNEGSTA